MAQTKHEIQAMLDRIGARPRRRFGQNFMIDANMVRLVADSAEIAPGDLVVEVGPGTGTLTEELLERCCVLAIELDRDLAELLRHRFAGRGGFELIVADALAGKHRLNPQLLERIEAHRAEHPGSAIRLAANLPYNIASPLVIGLLEAGMDSLTFTVQKEVAERLRAGAGDEAYGPLSVMARLLGEVELLRSLPPQLFWPAPNVESALVRIRRKPRSAIDIRAFSRFVHRVFASRRKTLRKALEVAGFDSAVVLIATGLDPRIRPEQLDLDQLLALAIAAFAAAG